MIINCDDLINYPKGKKLKKINKNLVLEGSEEYKNHKFIILFSVEGYRTAYIRLSSKEIVILFPDTICENDYCFLMIDLNNNLCIEDLHTSEKYFGSNHPYIMYKKMNPNIIIFKDVDAEIITYDCIKNECHNFINQILIQMNENIKKEVRHAFMDDALY